MSKLRPPTARKPSFVQSPNRTLPSPAPAPAPAPAPVPSRRGLRSSNVQSTPVPLMKTGIPNRLSDAEELGHRSISSDLQALEKMVKDEFGNYSAPVPNFDSTTNTFDIDPSVVYERGRFYDEYSARRNERLKRRRSTSSATTGQEKKTSPYKLGVNVESGKKRGDSKKFGSLKKPPAHTKVSVTETPRYSLRSSSRETKKPPLAPVNFDKSVVKSEARMGTRRTRGI